MRKYLQLDSRYCTIIPGHFFFQFQYKKAEGLGDSVLDLKLFLKYNPSFV